MAERRYLGAALRESAGLYVLGIENHRTPLAAYPEHNDVKWQADFVTKLRVGIRLFIARCYREEARGRPDRALRMAKRAGQYWGEYRRHWSHLRSLPDFQHNPTYGPSR